MPRFAVELVYADDPAERLEIRPKHREYLQELAARGVLLGAGPHADDKGALVIYEADDEAGVREIIANDPYSSVNAVAEWRIREWNLLIGPWVS